MPPSPSSPAPLCPRQAHANLANALQQLGSTDLALLYYQSALRLRPAFTDAINNMAAAYLQKGLVLQVGPQPSPDALVAGGRVCTPRPAEP